MHLTPSPPSPVPQSEPRWLDRASRRLATAGYRRKSPNEATGRRPASFAARWWLAPLEPPHNPTHQWVDNQPTYPRVEDSLLKKVNKYIHSEAPTGILP